MNESCIFCKIIKGEIPADIIYQDDICIGFLDIHPVSHGHSLIIPKEHHTWMWETPDDILAHINIVAKNIIQKMITNLPCDYVKISIVGTDVPHFHIHLIPQKITSGITDPDFRTTQTYSNEDEKESVIQKIRGEL